MYTGHCLALRLRVCGAVELTRTFKGSSRSTHCSTLPFPSLRATLLFHLSSHARKGSLGVLSKNVYVLWFPTVAKTLSSNCCVLVFHFRAPLFLERITLALLYRTYISRHRAVIFSRSTLIYQTHRHFRSHIILKLSVSFSQTGRALNPPASPSDLALRQKEGGGGKGAAHHVLTRSGRKGR